ncbi:hypothetical protein AG0111_0g11963 [Alternaria gaisen]|uniref:Uncharacterized protein n=1 Tax=Alternaria gaisen TaxID=167740 RepID=A0ACB6F635_9PLEO|nr:hypothetical protein AG0111_0g11963 [Alternaria gaisen]
MTSYRRDGILRPFSLDQSQFHPKYTEELNDKQVFILIEAYHPEDINKLLGFIQSTSNQDDYCVEGHNQIRRNPSRSQTPALENHVTRGSTPVPKTVA